MQKTFNQSVEDFTTLSRDSSTANETLGKSLINTFIGKILTSRDWVFNRSSYEDASVADQQSYPKPYNCAKIRSIKVNVSDVNYFPTEITDRNVWANLNRTEVSSDSAQYFFVETDAVELYPIPATAGNTITIYFQKLIKTLSATDYTTGEMSVTTPYTTAIVGSPGTIAWTSAMVGRWIVPTDDGYAYEISAVGHASSITTEREVRMSLTNSEYKITEMIPLPTGFQDLPLWASLSVYFQKKEGSVSQAREYERLYREGLERLLRTDSKSTGSVLSKSDLAGVEGIININDYPLDME